MALGAHRRRILLLVLKNGMKLTAIGLLVATIRGRGASRLIGVYGQLAFDQPKPSLRRHHDANHFYKVEDTSERATRCLVAHTHTRQLKSLGRIVFSDKWMLTVVHHPLSRQRHDIRPPSRHADAPTDGTTASGTKHGAHGILEIIDAQTSSSPGLVGVVRIAGTIREQLGEETIPNNPKRS